jgi:hypothetical protein
MTLKRLLVCQTTQPETIGEALPVFSTEEGCHGKEAFHRQRWLKP